MARKKKIRRVSEFPESHSFLPHGSPPNGLTVLSLDGYEAIRLNDYEGVTQDTAAAQMGISRATFSRILEEARKKVAEAILSGHVLRIQGGSYRLKR